MIFTDYIFILIVGLSTLFGFARGFIREIFTILNITLASFASYFIYPHSYDFFAGQIKNEMAIQALSTSIPFIIFWILFIFINSFVVGALGGMKGNFVDRIIGTVFGLLRGSAVVAMVYLNVILVSGAQEDTSKVPEWLSKTKTYNLTKMSGEIFLITLPRDVARCYKFVDACSTDKLKESLIRTAIYSESEDHLRKMGLADADIETLSKIYHDMPNGFGTKLSNDEIAKLEDPKAIRAYGRALISDYQMAVDTKEIKQDISEETLDSLSKSLDNMHAIKDENEPATNN